MANDPTARLALNLSFDIALLPGMMRAMRLMPAVALASSGSSAFREAFRQIQTQLLHQSPLSELDVIDDSAWFNMVTSLRSATRISIRRETKRHSDRHDTIVSIDNLEFTVARDQPKEHPAYDEIEAIIRSLAPSAARWQTRAGPKQRAQ
ncbi:hypothetical protein [Bosea massiliensis]|uniref:Uncharacterized protein n=1 Tax=Bosea massiliensis TaxID=151419 RepID=A0ABW0P704_9HYPH